MYKCTYKYKLETLHMHTHAYMQPRLHRNGPQKRRNGNTKHSTGLKARFSIERWSVPRCVASSNSGWLYGRIFLAHSIVSTGMPSSPPSYLRLSFFLSRLYVTVAGRLSEAGDVGRPNCCCGGV